MTEPIVLRNGTRIEIGPDWAITTLPNGKQVPAQIEARTAAIAADMGTTPAELTQLHDPLHSVVCEMIGAPHSFSLMAAAGEDVDAELVELEEVAVMALQRLIHAVRRKA